MSRKNDENLAQYYNETGDLSGFDDAKAEPVAVKRAVTISVRFSEEEIAELRDRADRAGVKVTSFIRAAALETTRPVDLTTLSELAQELERRAHDVAAMAARGVA